MSDADFPLPPPTFEFLAISLKTQVEIHLGMLHFGGEADRPKPDFRAARHSIDMLAMLQEKTKGNLTIEEQRLIENSLTELRFRFVQSLEQSKKETATTSAAAPSETTTTTSAPATEESERATEPQEKKEGQAAE